MLLSTPPNSDRFGRNMSGTQKKDGAQGTPDTSVVLATTLDSRDPLNLRI
jgi:hypothetical protein